MYNFIEFNYWIYFTRFFDIENKYFGRLSVDYSNYSVIYYNAYCSGFGNVHNNKKKRKDFS